VLAHAETPWYRAQSYYDSGDWRGTWALDGGVLANQSPHMIDRLIWLAGEVEEVTDATAHCGLERNIEAETVAVAKARLAGGALATITGTTLAYNGLPQRVVICGTEGSAAFEGDTLTHFKTSKPFEEANEADATTTPGGAGNALDIGTNLHTLNIKDFATAVLEGRQPLATGIDGRRVVDALNKIYRAAKVGPFA
jgi:UDP-N-acetyl-2-amino-2-deoxyglucuronate dehydrogenase